jgi:hypothetical protein
MQLFVGGGKIGGPDDSSGWPGGYHCAFWQTQSGPGTGGMQLIALVGGGGVGACPPAGSRLADDITASRNDTHKPTRRMIDL